MLLVADSGSTKADWLAAENGKITGSFSTMGFNPFFHDAKLVVTELNKNKAMKKIAKEVKEVFFYGAGCSSNARNKIIKDGLKKFFSNAKVLVDHDMLGAALSACHNNNGLVCILGTGSNIAYFDGKKLSETRHGLAYILGDENSGSYYGKKLITSFLYRIMPNDLSKAFFAEYKMTKEKAIKHVYQLPNANVYLASFAKFLSQHKDHPWIQQLVYRGMLEFYETSIASYKEHKSAPVHFIGSIAYFFKDSICKVADEKGFKVGKIIVKPVNDLMEYFLLQKQSK